VSHCLVCCLHKANLKTNGIHHNKILQLYLVSSTSLVALFCLLILKRTKLSQTLETDEKHDSAFVLQVGTLLETEHPIKKKFAFLACDKERSQVANISRKMLIRFRRDDRTYPPYIIEKGFQISQDRYHDHSSILQV